MGINTTTEHYYQQNKYSNKMSISADRQQVSAPRSQSSQRVVNPTGITGTNLNRKYGIN